jgi:cytochrome c biogenesis protein
MKNEYHKHGLLDAVWNFFASVKLTVTLLILLAATSIVGTLIPQNAEPGVYLKAFGEFAYRLLNVFDLFDMYRSWWFQTLIVLLVVNLVVCTLKRWPAIWKVVSSTELKSGSFKKKKPLLEFSNRRQAGELDSLYVTHVAKRFRKHRVEPDGEGFRIVAEKGRWSRLGVPVVHLSVVLVLVGALIGSIFGFDGFVNIAEGESADHIRLRSGNQILPLGFEVRCDDFDVSFYDTGAPKEFRSSLVILENGRESTRKDIIVNDPMRYKGINFFQSSYGALPPKKFDLVFRSTDSDRTFRQTAFIGQAVALPDGDGRFTVQQFNQDYHFRGSEIGQALMGILERPGQEPVEVALPLRFPSFDKMRKDRLIISVAGVANSYYTGLQVTKDPGVPLVYAGFILLVAGCWVAFFISHQKIVVDVQPSPNSSRVKIFGSATRNRVGFETAVRKMGNEMKQL